ncbi:MAG: AI-2E family transporter [Hyphomicrobiales bacterium]|nr:AI-2E family transporter [Hyphomicrobiales bacterium]
MLTKTPAEEALFIKAMDKTDDEDPQLSVNQRLLYVATAILVIISFYALYFVSPVIVPIILAVLITMLLTPVRRQFDNIGLPRPISSLLVVALFFSVLGSGAYALSGPVQAWMERMPKGGEKIERMLRSIKKPFAQISKASEEIEQATNMQGGGAPLKVQIAVPSLSARVVEGGAQLLASVSVITVLVFFLLSAGDTFLRKLVSVIPSLKDKKQMVDVIRNIETDISFYLLFLTSVNVGIGVGVGLITWAMGIPDPLLWGALTAILSFAPYVGELAILVILLVISMLTFDTLVQALVVPAAFLVLMSAVHLTVPLVVRRRLFLNPVAVFIMVIILGWMWGIVGALIAVPLLASFKVICERIERLNPIAAFLTP